MTTKLEPLGIRRVEALHYYVHDLRAEPALLRGADGVRGDGRVDRAVQHGVGFVEDLRVFLQVLLLLFGGVERNYGEGFALITPLLGTMKNKSFR